MAGSGTLSFRRLRSAGRSWVSRAVTSEVTRRSDGTMTRETFSDPRVPSRGQPLGLQCVWADYRNLPEVPWAGHGEKAPERRFRIEERAQKGEYPFRRQPAQAEQNDARRRRLPMMKHQFAEILIEREYDAVLIKRRTQHLFIRCGNQSLRGIEDVVPGCSQRPDDGRREILVRQIAVRHAGLPAGGNR